MAEENLIETKEENIKKDSKIKLYLAMTVPIILMLVGFFLVTKFINPRFNISGGNAISGGESSESKSDMDKSKKHGKNKTIIHELGSVLANPIGTDGRRFVKVGVCLELGSKDLAKQIDESKSKLQHQLILILSSKDIETLTSPTGKALLLDEIKKSMIAQLELTNEDLPNIYFSEFIVQ
ncbi:TPA: flagellar basal body-associated FliL family protein [bacterium]|nr:flagellar basal body-associated FliL family protein [bacterium]